MRMICVNSHGGVGDVVPPRRRSVGGAKNISPAKKQPQGQQHQRSSRCRGGGRGCRGDESRLLFGKRKSSTAISSSASSTDNPTPILREDGGSSSSSSFCMRDGIVSARKSLFFFGVKREMRVSVCREKTRRGGRRRYAHGVVTFALASSSRSCWCCCCSSSSSSSFGGFEEKRIELWR